MERGLRVKKIVGFILLAVILLVGSVAVPARADAAAKTKTIKTIKKGTKVTVGTLKYKVTKVTKKGGTAAVIGMTGKGTSVKIPASIKVKVKSGKYKGVHTIKVTAVGKAAFAGNRKVKTVTVGGNVKTIGEKAFYKMSNLKTVSIGKNVTTIGVRAFGSDTSLTTVTLAKGSLLTTIKSYAFHNCIYLRSFNFATATKLTTIESAAFYGCDLLTTIPREKTAEVKTLKSNLSKYTFSVQPLFPGFNYYFYLKTNYPDGTKIRLVDKSSKLYTKETTECQYIELCPDRFADVKYVNEAKGQVKGGFIFESNGGKIDGGTLNLEIYTDALDPNKYSPEWVDTGIKINCPKVTSSSQYLIENYTNSKMTFFEKLGAIQSALSSLAIYPKGTYDSTKRNAGYYPALATSPYMELGLNEHFESLYARAQKRTLSYWGYPYVLDSLGFPGTISGIAQMLNPSCKVSSGGVHYMIQVSYNGETHYYGGAGSGGTDELYTSCITAFYSFDGSKTDLGTNPSVEKAQSAYFNTASKSSALIKSFRDQLSGDTFNKAIGNGSWIRAAQEGFFGGGGKSYCYYYSGLDYSKPSSYKSLASNMWVDGRYINSWEYFEKGTAFDEHPTASILMTNQTYTTYYGQTVTGDLYYSYDSVNGYWKCDSYFYDKSKGYSYGYNKSDSEYPDRFIITKDEIAGLGIDRNKDTYPASGLIYDGTAEPGTPFGASK